MKNFTPFMGALLVLGMVLGSVGVSFAVPQSKELKEALQKETLDYQKQKAAKKQEIEAEKNKKLTDLKNTLSQQIGSTRDPAQRQSYREAYAQRIAQVKADAKKKWDDAQEELKTAHDAKVSEIKQTLGAQ